MLTLVIYDIGNDRTRKKIADRLLDLGLIRAQYSVFLGMLAANRVDEFTLYAEAMLEDHDRLYVMPIQRDDLASARIVGRGFDQQLVTDDLLTKVI